MTMPPAESVRTVTNIELEREYQARAKASGMTSPKAIAAAGGSGFGAGVGAALAEIIADEVPGMADNELALGVIISAFLAALVSASTTWLSPANKLKV